MLNRLLEGYGSFFALNHPASKFLIFIAAMLQPLSGLFGLVGGLSVILARKLLNFQSETERIETVNGILLGMLIGSLYAPDYRTVLLTMCGGALVVLTSAILTETLARQYRLPLLGLPYGLAAYILLPVAANLRLDPAMPAYTYSLPMLPIQAFLWLYPMGAMYFNGTTIGGLLVLTAFAISSRYLAIIAVGSSILCCAFLEVLAVPSNTTLFMVAQMNGVLSACIIGGLCATPGKRSLLVAISAAACACVLSLCLSRLLWVFGLPVLALPFVISTYACMLSLNPGRGKAWTYFWLPAPALPERSMEQIETAKARGVDVRSIALKPPFDGEWQIYQGFGGKHTHTGNWQYALDFFQTQEERSFWTDGRLLCDYYAFGKPVLAPAYGTVIDCRNDLPDNPPGEVDAVNNWGNFILIQLDFGPCVLLAHLQKSSLKVAPYARVHPGQVIASVGNSGRSPQPHLHLHVQETAIIGSKTLPFHLTSVTTVASDAPTDTRNTFSLRACPKEGDTIATPRRNPAIKRALRLIVGTQFQFEVAQANAPTAVSRLEVKLDIYGQFWLESATGARVAFVCNDDFVAFYNRTGPKDMLLDALILNIGLTPFCEGGLEWTDVASRRLLPMNSFTRLAHALWHPLKACALGKFKRTWDPLTQLWHQTCEYSLGGDKWRTHAKLCEANGLVCVSLFKKGAPLLTARLIGYGIREDYGIPEQQTSLLAAV
ncbi:MAG: urea transporter [Candidatus Obscuribacterales bacterium]